MKTTVDHFERAIDDALKMTFPASDPIAISVGSLHRTLESSRSALGAYPSFAGSHVTESHIGY